MDDEYNVDMDRLSFECGIPVRAKRDGKFGTHDLAELDTDSIKRWLRSRGGANEWAENTVLILLHHNAHADKEPEIPAALLQSEGK